MRNTSYFIAGSIALLALGCAGGSNNSPLAPAGPSNTDQSAPIASAAKNLVAPPPAYAGSVNATLGGFALDGDVAESALGIYTVDLDAASLSATAHLKQVREGAANDDLYLLSIDSFLKDTSFKIRSVGGTATTIDLTYSLSHPFPAASDPSGTPNGSTNRADLGISGQTLFMVDVADATGNTFFDETGTGGDSVIVNSTLIANADAFVTPAGLLATSGVANTFPYQSLVDELSDSREGVSNGADVTGNFGADGWTRGEMGGTHDQWAGFGVLHQGQTSVRKVSFDKAALLAAGGFSFDVAVLAKYQDPRGGANGVEKKGNRLPPASADATKFAYRMPHGALDVERIEFDGDSGGFWTNMVSASTLEFHVTDWDARATETVAADLSADTDVTTVAVGESGLPRLAICVPGVLGDATTIDDWDPTTTITDDDSIMGGDGSADSGRPGDELFYVKSVTKLVQTGQADGDYRGLVRAIDPEFDLDPALTIALDGALAPLTANLPKPVTYKGFGITMITPNAAPSATFSLASNPIQSATAAQVTALTYGDADGDPISVDIDWNGDGDFADASETAAMSLPGGGGVPVTLPSPTTYINTDLVNDSYSLAIRYTDGQIPTPLTVSPLALTVTGNRAPVVAGTPALASSTLQTPAVFTMNAGTATATDPEGDAITYVVTGSVSPVGPFGPSATLPISGIGPYTPGSITFKLYARDAMHASLIPAQPDSAVAYPTVAGTVQACAVAPFTATNIAAFWNTGARATGVATGMGGGGWGWNDMAGVGFSNSGNTGAVVCLTQATAGAAPTYIPLGGTATNQIQRISAVTAGTPVLANMTAWTNATILNPPSTTLLNATVSQIDVDSTGRVLFLTRGSASDVGSPINGTDTSGGLGTYSPTAAMHAGIKWFDFNYTTNATVAADPNVITTTGAAPIALTVDPVSNAVYTIDLGHQLKKYQRTGATTYAVVASAQINLLPIIGDGTGVGAANKKVHDFVYDSYNGAFFILVQSLEAAAAPGNGYVYRVECDGTVNANINGAGTNPVKMVLNNSATQAEPADIAIDLYGASGVLGAQQDVQILVGGANNATAGVPEVRTFNAKLALTASADTARNCSKLAVSFNDGLFTKGADDYTSFDFYYPSGKPAGWQ